MPRRSPTARNTKPVEDFHWPGYTPEETRSWQVFHKVFGTLTSVPADYKYVPLPWHGRRCPDCETWYETAKWPYCGFCRTRDPRAVELGWN